MTDSNFFNKTVDELVKLIKKADSAKSIDKKYPLYTKLQVATTKAYSQLEGDFITPVIQKLEADEYEFANLMRWTFFFECVACNTADDKYTHSLLVIPFMTSSAYGLPFGEVPQEALEKMASVYTKMSYPKRANDIYKRLIEDYNSSYIAYYKIGLITPEKELDYLKKSVSINPSYQDGWIDLARVMLDKGNISLAKSYLSVANYLDDSNFRYYYYQSLLNKKEAEMNSIKNSNDVLNKIAGRE